MEKELKVLTDSGNIYSTEEYLTLSENQNILSTPIGVVFESPLIGKRVLALQSWKEQWGEEELCTENCSEVKAIQILSGLENTKRIVKAQTNVDNMSAVKRCWEYKAGGLQWYLPSLMELGVIYILRHEINKVIKQLGCNNDCLLPDKNDDEPYIWSSIEMDQSHGWNICFDCGSYYSEYKHDTLITRAIAKLQLVSSNTLVNKERLDIKLTDEELISVLQQRGYKGRISRTLVI